MMPLYRWERIDWKLLHIQNASFRALAVDILIHLKNRKSMVQSRYFGMSRNTFNDCACQIRLSDF